MPNRTPSAEQSAEIQRQIDALGPPPGEAWHEGAWPTRVCKEELNALPLLASEIFTWVLRPDGAVLRMDRDSLFHPTEPETEPLTIYAVLQPAALESPQLKPLVPEPPAGTRRCTTCGGDGVLEPELGERRAPFSASAAAGSGGWTIPTLPGREAHHPGRLI